MFIFRVLILAFLYVFTLGAVSSPMSGTAVEKYIQKKLKRNNKILRINEKNLGDLGLAVLAQSPLLRSVTTLVLYKVNISDEGVRALAESPHLKNLEALYLEHNFITDRGVEIISNSMTFSKLKILNLFYNQITDVGAKAIADSDTLTQLAELNLNYNQIKGPGAIDLTHSKKLPKLHNIQLAYNPIKKKGKRAWKRFQLMEGFKELHRKNQLNQVGEGLIGNFGVLVLLDFVFVSELETLDLRNNDYNSGSTPPIESGYLSLQ